MQWLVRGASPNDSLFFHCKLGSLYIYSSIYSHSFSDSGHGGQSKDGEGDEADGFDEGAFLYLKRSILAKH